MARTMQDIARLAGVSRVAVSYALNGRPGVSAQVRERILTIAREVGFSPNAQALAMRGAAAHAVGLVLQRPSSGFHQELISGMQIALSERGFGLVLQFAASPHEELAIYKRWHAQRRVDGIVLCDPRLDDERKPALRRLGLPTVVIGGRGDYAGLANLWSDEAAAAAKAAGYLHALGHRRVALAPGMPGTLQTAWRTAAFTTACHSFALTLTALPFPAATSSPTDPPTIDFPHPSAFPAPDFPHPSAFPAPDFPTTDFRSPDSPRPIGLPTPAGMTSSACVTRSQRAVDSAAPGPHAIDAPRAADSAVTAPVPRATPAPALSTPASAFPRATHSQPASALRVTDSPRLTDSAVTGQHVTDSPRVADSAAIGQRASDSPRLVDSPNIATRAGDAAARLADSASIAQRASDAARLADLAITTDAASATPGQGPARQPALPASATVADSPSASAAAAPSETTAPRPWAGAKEPGSVGLAPGSGASVQAWAAPSLVVRGEEWPTAIVYDNDLMAIAGLRAAVEHGLSVPGDLSIVSWEDSALCQAVRPALSVLRRNLSDIGVAAIRLLFEWIDGQAPRSVQHENATFVVRGSTTPPQ